MLTQAEVPPEQLDAESVDCLQGTCPARSTHDARRVRADYDQGRLAACIGDQGRRLLFLDAALGIPYIIPSLHTVLENAKFLEVGAISLHRILSSPPTSSQASLIDRYRAHYDATRVQVHIEMDDMGSLREQRCKDGEEAFKTSFRVVCLHALRHFVDLQDIQPRKRGGARSLAAFSFDRLGSVDRLAACVQRAGFRIPQLGIQPPGVVESMIAAIQRSPTLSCIPREEISTAAQHLYATLQAQAQRHRQTMLPPRTTREPSLPAEDGIRYRCGRPWDSSFEYDRVTLYHDQVFRRQGRPSSSTNQGFLTTAYCLCDTIRTFFCEPAEHLLLARLDHR